MKYYYLVFALTASFTNSCSAMSYDDQTAVNNLNLAIFLHNQSKKTRPLSILKKSSQDDPTTRTSIVCDIDTRYINGKYKDINEIENELKSYLERFHQTPPKNIIRAPNKIWIQFFSADHASLFSFNAEGKLMFDGKVLVEKNQNKKLNFGSFAGESIMIRKLIVRKNWYRADFKDWNNLSYALYIHTKSNQIVDQLS